MDTKKRNLPDRNAVAQKKARNDITTNEEILQQLQDLTSTVTQMAADIASLKSAAQGVQTMQIYIVDSKGECFTLGVSSTDTVWDVKNLIYLKNGMSASDIQLLYNTETIEDVKFLFDEFLADNKTLAECGIKRWSRVNFGMPIEVCDVDSTRHQLYVTPFFKVRDVKDLLLKKQGKSGETISLFLDNRQLDDSRTLQSCNIHQSSEIQIGLHIEVCDVDYSRHQLHVTPLYKVEDVKLLINKRQRRPIPIESMDLFIDNKQLEDSETLQTYGVQQSSHIGIAFPVTVVVDSSSTIDLDIHTTETFAHIKSRIQAKADVSEIESNLRDFSNGFDLADSDTVAQCLVKKGDWIILPGCLTGAEMAKAMKKGVRVKRGKDWACGNEDSGGPGTVTKELYNYRGGHYVNVAWDKARGEEGGYAMRRGKYELQLVTEDVAADTDAVDTDAVDTDAVDTDAVDTDAVDMVETDSVAE